MKAPKVQMMVLHVLYINYKQANQNRNYSKVSLSYTANLVHNIPQKTT